MNSKRKKLTDDHRALYLLIPEGRENAYPLNFLCEMMGASERVIRQMIEDLTTNGCVVCNLQNGKGYFRPTTDDDFEAMIKLSASRAKSLLRKEYAIKKALERFKYNGSTLFAHN